MKNASAVLLVCACLVLCATQARALLPDALVAELAEHGNRDDLRAQLTAEADPRAEALAIGDLARDFVRMRSVLTQLHAPMRKWQARQAQKLAVAQASATGNAASDGEGSAASIAATILPAETMADLASTLHANAIV